MSNSLGAGLPASGEVAMTREASHAAPAVSPRESSGSPGRRGSAPRRLSAYIRTKTARKETSPHAAIRLDWPLREAGLRERASVVWTASPLFGFGQIDWGPTRARHRGRDGEPVHARLHAGARCRLRDPADRWRNACEAPETPQLRRSGNLAIASR